MSNNIILAAYPQIQVRAAQLAMHDSNPNPYNHFVTLGFSTACGGIQQVNVNMRGLEMRPDAEDLCEAARALMIQIDRTTSLGLRVQAEAYQIGGKKLPKYNWWMERIAYPVTGR